MIILMIFSGKEIERDRLPLASERNLPAHLSRKDGISQEWVPEAWSDSGTHPQAYSILSLKDGQANCVHSPKGGDPVLFLSRKKSSA